MFSRPLIIYVLAYFGGIILGRYPTLIGLGCILIALLYLALRQRTLLVICLIACLLGFGLSVRQSHRRPQPYQPPQILQQIKNYLTGRNAQTMPTKYAAILNSMIFGTSAAPLDQTVITEYRRAGIIHLLVVSGTQIALLSGSIMAICQRLGLGNGVTALIVTFFNLSFTLLSGAGASIVRACFMSEIGLLAPLVKREYDVYTSLSFSAFLLSLLNPWVLWDLGFQLSYVATFSLVYAAPILTKVFAKAGKLAPILGTSTAPFVLTTPLVAYYYHGISLASLPVNILLLPWVESLVLTGFFATLVSSVSLVLGSLVNSINWLMLIFIDLLVSCSQIIPYLTLPTMSLAVLFLIYLGLFTFFEYLKQPRPILRSACTLSLLIVCTAWGLALVNPTVTVSVCDVGQGDAIIIETPEKIALIDCGSDNRNAARIVRRQLNNKTPDFYVATHHHADHVNGLYRLVSRNVWITEENAPATITLNQATVLQRITHEETFDSKNKNNRSLVYLLSSGKFRMLLTGDAEKELETSILSAHPTLNLDIDVLKVGHHGSKTSSTEPFIARVRPEVSIISVASPNRYNHPSPITEMRLQRYGKVYETRLNGTVKVIIHPDGTYIMEVAHN
jgi:competence protein ComEC